MTRSADAYTAPCAAARHAGPAPLGGQAAILGAYGVYGGWFPALILST